MYDKNPSLRVVETVADVEESDPSDLSPPLASAIDPDALDRLMESADSDGPNPCCSVSFTYCGCDVDVHSNGRVVVE